MHHPSLTHKMRDWWFFSTGSHRLYVSYPWKQCLQFQTTCWCRALKWTMSASWGEVLWSAHTHRGTAQHTLILHVSRGNDTHHQPPAPPPIICSPPRQQKLMEHDAEICCLLHVTLLNVSLWLLGKCQVNVLRYFLLLAIVNKNNFPHWILFFYILLLLRTNII